MGPTGCHLGASTCLSGGQDAQVALSHCVDSAHFRRFGGRKRKPQDPLAEALPRVRRRTTELESITGAKSSLSQAVRRRTTIRHPAGIAKSFCLGLSRLCIKNRRPPWNDVSLIVRFTTALWKRQALR